MARLFSHNNIMERKWKPSLKIINKIIQDYGGQVFRIAKELQCEVSDLEKYEALWPNNNLREHLDRQAKFVQSLREAKEREKLNKNPVGRPKLNLEAVRKVIEENEGNREKAAKELNCSKKYVDKLIKKIYYSYRDFQYHKPLMNKKEYDIFPSNEERLYYLDNPECLYYRGRTEQAIRKANKCSKSKEAEA